MLQTHYRRTIVVGVTAGATIVWLLTLGLVGAPAQADDAFVNGSARASAVVARVAPGVGALSLAVTEGVAIAQQTNALAQSQAQAVDLGLIGLAATSDSCSGGDATIKPSDLPQPTTVDNRKGPATTTRDQQALGPAIGGGRMTATATPTPSAQAITSTAAIAVDPVIGIGGGKAEASTSIIDGKARQAVASVVADVTLAGGAVQLKGLKWEAIHRTGEGAVQQATFEIGSVSGNGIALPTANQETLETLLNTVLAPSGIRIEFPVEERITKPNDLIRMTPMRVVLEDSPAGKTVLGPGINLSREQREQLFDEAVNLSCQLATPLLVGDVSVQVLAGTGFLAVEIGGASATTAATAFESPFGAISPPVAAPTGDVPAASSTGEIVATPTGFADSTGFVQTAPGDTIYAAPAGSVGPLEKVCETVHQYQNPGCSRGAAMALGVVGLAATGAVFGADLARQRRRKPAAVTL